jgi:4-amino-4-deoxy-L-arabinose transferase-like glycosyltransferase
MKRPVEPEARAATPALRRWRLLLVLAVASSVRLGNLSWMAAHPLSEDQTVWAASDMAVHWQWSDRILAGDVLGREPFQPYLRWMRRIAPQETWERWRGGKHVFQKAPLYPYLLAGMRLVGGDGFWGFGLGQAALGVLNVWLIFLLAERFFGLGAATVAGLGAALYGPFLLHETLVLRDTLGVSVTLLLLWGLARCTKETPRRWFGAGLLFALALLARELTLLFGPFVVLWAVERTRGGWKAVGRVLLAFGAGVALGVAPLVARNVAVGAPPWALSALGNEGFVYGHAAGALPAGFFVPPSAAAVLQGADGRLADAIRLTLATYDGDWGRLVRHELERLAAIFARHEAADNVSWYYFADRSPLLRFSLRWEIVLAFGLVGVWIARRRGRDHRLLAYCLLPSLAALQYTTVVGRYRLVPAALLLVSAGACGCWLADALWRRRFGPALAASVAVLLIIGVSASLLPTFATRHRYRAAEYAVAAAGYLRRREPVRAYEEARAGLATAYAGPDRHLPPDYVGLAKILVYAAEQGGRTADAAAVLQAQLRSHDQDPDLRRLLAEVIGTARGAGD